MCADPKNTEPAAEVAAHEAPEEEHPPLHKGVIGFMAFIQVLVLCMFAAFVEYDSAKLGSGDATNMTFDQQEKDLDFSNSRLYPFFQDVHVMVFVGFGFLMTFLKRYQMSSVGFNFFIAAQLLQWTILSNGFWHRVFEDKFDHKITLETSTLVTADFGAATVLISMGAMLGKTGPVQLLMMGFIEIMFYSINESIGVIELQAVDMGGSMYVHMFGAFFGCACSFMYMKDKDVSEADKKGLNSADRQSDMFAMIGTLFLWMFWPSFNGALATGSGRNRVVINTVLAISSSCTAAFLFSYLLRGKLSMVDIQNATLAGGVAVGSSSDLVIDAWPAMLCGTIAGIVSVSGYVYLQPALAKIGLHDTCGVLNLHGIPGMIGAIGGAISAAAESDNDLYGQHIGAVFPARAGPDGKSASWQGSMQAACMFVTLGISISGGLITGLLMKYVKIDFNGEDVLFEDSKYWEIEGESEDEAAPINKEGNDVVV